MSFGQNYYSDYGSGSSSNSMSDGDGKKKLSGAQSRKTKLEKEVSLKKNTSSIKKFFVRPGLSSDEHLETETYKTQDNSTAELVTSTSPPPPLLSLSSVVEEDEEPSSDEASPENILQDIMNDLALWPQVLSDKQRIFLMERGPVQPTSWPPQDTWSSYQSQRSMDRPIEQKSLSYQDLATGKCTLEDLSRDFQMNGIDSPYTPLEDSIWSNRATGLSGMGPAGAYCRQTSWPAPERSPAPRLARPRSHCTPEASNEFTSSTPVEAVEDKTAGAEASASLSAEQARVLASLPNTVLFSLLHDLEQARGNLQKRSKKVASQECRFCKNNGERESYYRAHALKDGAGRVTCPVLRAFVCRRCGARGDSAHTSKYCPLSTAAERMKSTAMMRSVLMASGRRRPAPPAREQFVAFGETTPSVISDTNAYNAYALTLPLDPLWAALEQKLLL